ncbi:MAG: hypothetical protein HYZ91_01530 [Candidatus Omnitrophica bacterium]|nr:hypothetical protein [Candidatus Omnitrophota bacterium]
MSKYLKGNYELSKDGAKPEEKTPDEPSKNTVTQEFERRALGRLGGSIAFVLKGKTFVWNGEAQPGPATRTADGAPPREGEPR